MTPVSGLSLIHRNPILFADYSDPDVIRDGLNYYLVASTFHFVLGIPILESNATSSIGRSSATWFTASIWIRVTA